MEDDYMSDEDYMQLEHYLEIGAIEVEGVDEDGEIIFSITEQAKDIAPELWQAHSDYIDRQLLDLFEKGIIDIEYNEDLEAEVKVSKAGIEYIRSMGIFPLEIEEEGEE
jgi:hypothetical protein